MPNIRRLVKNVHKIKGTTAINWHPGHMFSGMKAMIGKLNSVDCVVEVHDARIPLIGRNNEFRQHLGLIKPHILVLNKSDLADLTKWDLVETKLAQNGDNNVLLTDLSGSEFSHSSRGYDKLLDKAVKIINQSNRYNRSFINNFKIMIVGIPNVGKSTLINRLRQHHLGSRGEASRTGNMAGVTRHVENMIKICARPLIYSIDTPGVLEPSVTKDHDNAMRLALCSTINDKLLRAEELTNYLLNYLNKIDNLTYQYYLGLEKPASNSVELLKMVSSQDNTLQQIKLSKNQASEGELDIERVCWKFVKLFRNGALGKVMFE